MRVEKMKSAKIKAGNYCAYRERTHQEVRDKLYDLGLHRDEVEEVLTELIMEDFVNEERFARSFARGKFILKRWGKVKIAYELKRRKISPYCIEKAMLEIPHDDYDTVLLHLIEQKKKSYTGDLFKVKNKIARYLINKGYESDLVWDKLKDY
jgi:regulatory protein